jgi:hypothetical protein
VYIRRETLQRSKEKQLQFCFSVFAVKREKGGGGRFGSQERMANPLIEVRRGYSGRVEEEWEGEWRGWRRSGRGGVEEEWEGGVEEEWEGGGWRRSGRGGGWRREMGLVVEWISNTPLLNSPQPSATHCFA